MKSILLDTNVLVDFMNGDKALSAIISSADRVVLPSVVLGEFHAGLDNSVRGRRQLAVLTDIMSDSAVEYIGATENTPVFYAKIFRHLKAAGTPIPANDIWVAAFALETGSELLTRDQHFARIPMLLLSIPQH